MSSDRIHQESLATLHEGLATKEAIVQAENVVANGNHIACGVSALIYVSMGAVKSRASSARS